MNIFTKLFKKTSQPEKTIFIVEDNDEYAKSLQGFLMTRFPDVKGIKLFPSREACLMNLNQNPTVIIMHQLLKTNYNDTAVDLSTIKKIKAASSKTNIILLSTQKELDTAGKTIAKYGCTYIQKDKHTFYKVETIIKKYF